MEWHVNLRVDRKEITVYYDWISDVEMGPCCKCGKDTPKIIIVVCEANDGYQDIDLQSALGQHIITAAKKHLGDGTFQCGPTERSDH